MKKKDFDVLGILLGIFIGGVLGYFISTRIKAVDEVPVVAQPEETRGFIYVVETDKFDNPTGPINYITKLNEKGFNAVYIKKGDYYHIYCGVYNTYEDAENLQSVLSQYEYNAVINKEYILDATNHLDSANAKFNFYNYAIDCFINNLSGKSYEIDEEIIDSEIDTSLISDLIALSVVKKDTYISKLRLQIYKGIYEGLK